MSNSTLGLGKVPITLDQLATLKSHAVQNDRMDSYADMCFQAATDYHDKLVELSDRNPFTLLQKIRNKGLTVAVHNDYKLNGVNHTFWLFVDPKTNQSYKGEGKTDWIALSQVWSLIDPNHITNTPISQWVRCETRDLFPSVGIPDQIYLDDCTKETYVYRQGDGYLPIICSRSLG